jgi:hypothetical protein
MHYGDGNRRVLSPTAVTFKTFFAGRVVFRTEEIGA